MHGNLQQKEIVFAMTSNGAGPMIGGIDQLERLGLTIGNLSPKIRKNIKDHFPPAVPIHNGNPADVGGGATADDYNFVIEQFLDENNIDICYALVCIPR